jgi:hypothetical protein
MPAKSFAASSRDSGSDTGEPEFAVLSVASRNERAAVCKTMMAYE